MEGLGITAEKARTLKTPSLSNRLVTVDAQSNIHTYIQVYTFGSAERAQLEARGVRIEIVNEDYGIIQAWVPLDKIEEVAEISNTLVLPILPIETTFFSLSMAW